MIDAVSGEVRWTSRSTSIPSMSPSRRSVRTTSYRFSLRRRTASAPVVTAVTWWPSMVRIASIVVATLSSSSMTSTVASVTRRLRRPRDRERDDERRSLAGAAAHLHRAAVALDDAVRDPEAESGALLRLRREERLEDPRLRLLIHAHAAVLHLDAHGVERHAALGLDVVARRDAERAALGHRLGRVEEQIEQHLLQLVRRGADLRQRRVELAHHRD